MNITVEIKILDPLIPCEGTEQQTRVVTPLEYVELGIAYSKPESYSLLGALVRQLTSIHHIELAQIRLSEVNPDNQYRGFKDMLRTHRYTLLSERNKKKGGVKK